MTDKSKGDGGSSLTPDELRAQVEKTRQELGRTVEALAAKADVKAQAQQKAAKVKGMMHDKAAHALHTAHDKTPEPVREKVASAGDQLTETAHGLGRRRHNRDAASGMGGQGGHAGRNRNLLVFAGLAAAIAVIVVASRRGARCW
ncbi:hypothetical protein AR457_03880 [Streptomyces agglomeratus]|uniref:DUF3618 domain-containing protein n=1 Tax=Streptomyces agglomeratus TaxID=285458 RepID=A0A1E5P2M9_9ACTN|nr:DUF3618 domain-containing protein [Streptomyces agglomeratus]OEJ23762.1 hypothetical protein AS594_03985 [Streptomyces agglomeratus]OEJ43356.1 hypothetical protein AR457_03880 [Streptomyces agglomeratus]OEJ54725.1 hypothetical protein BGK72_31890 [Streptomyces agglomeratus]OEJ62097.1 hypothetical protein BGM19_32795 [Streptomyces agglomeratus]